MDFSERITRAFPSTMAGEVEGLANSLAAEGATLSTYSFSVTVGNECIAIPERLYADSRRALIGDGDAAACLLTRHHNGFVRQRALEQVLLLDEPWAVPFIVRLVGEYVVEIVEQIDEAFSQHLPDNLAAFVRANPDFIHLTRARVTSYWDCYFRTTPRREHVGFRLMDRIEAASVLQAVGLQWVDSHR